MAAKSPTTNVKSREVIGEEQFSQRREVFDKHDTVFLPLPSPTSPIPTYRQVDPIITSNHGKTTTNFKRNAPTYSSMRESRTESDDVEFRSRKYSDNFLSEFNRSDDDVDYRRSMTERTRRMSKLRREFLNTNIHKPGMNNRAFSHTSTPVSLPAGSVSKYKIETPNLHKFPFAEPYATPPPVRRVVVDLGPTGLNSEKENEDPESKAKHKSLPNDNNQVKSDGQKLKELMKRYSPQRKPVDWKLPPTRARVVGSVPKSTSSVSDNLDSSDKKVLNTSNNKPEDDEVFVKKENESNPSKTLEESTVIEKVTQKDENDSNITENAKNPGNKPDINIIPDSSTEPKPENDVKEKSDTKDESANTAELTNSLEINNDMVRNKSYEKFNDLTIPALIDKITVEGEDLESHKKQKKVKRNRSFLDKLLRRNKKDK